MANDKRVWFLQLARAIACLLIVYTHWLGLLYSPNAIAQLIVQNPIVNYPHLEVKDFLGQFAISLGMHYFNAVYFGLGVFFILSGYVIPLSLNKTTPYSYLIRRIFRIYPTAIVCLLIAASVMLISSHHLQSTVPCHFLKFKTFFANLTLLRDFFWVPFIDNSTWTLEIEIHFYIIFFLLFYCGIERKMSTFLLLTCALLFLSMASDYVFTHAGRFRSINDIITINSGYISFMLVGTCFYFISSKQWPLVKGTVCLFSILILNYFCLHTGVINKGPSFFIYCNHLYVFIFFILLFISNQWLPYSRILNNLAEISYPLYLTHGFTGYSFYYVSYAHTHNILLSACLSLSAVFFIAILIHLLVEKKGIEISKKLAHKSISIASFPFKKSVPTIKMESTLDS